MPGHTFVYSPAVNTIRALLTEGVIGDVYFVTSARMNLGKYQRDGVVCDLAPHDLSILMYWLDEPVVQVSTSGCTVFQQGVPETAFITLTFASGITANIQVSWLSPRKVRQMVIVGSKRMVQYDDTASDEPVRVYDRGMDMDTAGGAPASFGEYQLTYRSGDVIIPRIDAVRAPEPRAPGLLVGDPHGLHAPLQLALSASRSSRCSRRPMPRCGATARRSRSARQRGRGSPHEHRSAATRAARGHGAPVGLAPGLPHPAAGPGAGRARRRGAPGVHRRAGGRDLRARADRRAPRHEGEAAGRLRRLPGRLQRLPARRDAQARGPRAPAAARPRRGAQHARPPHGGGDRAAPEGDAGRAQRPRHLPGALRHQVRALAARSARAARRARGARVGAPGRPRHRRHPGGRRPAGLAAASAWAAPWS